MPTRPRHATMPLEMTRGLIVRSLSVWREARIGNVGELGRILRRGAQQAQLFIADALAAAAELALRAAAALAVRDGGSAVSVDQHAQRLAREAIFLLVFGSRPGIKNALLQRLGAVVRPPGK